MASLLVGALSACIGGSVVAESVMARMARESRAETTFLNIWKETRAFLWVALTVFTISVFAQLVFVRMAHSSLRDFFSQPRRTDMFLATTSINLVNGFIAGYLAMRAKNRERRWRDQQQQVNGYLNHHVRNALCSIQYAASLTEDSRAIQTCNDSVRRIVNALATAEAGIPHDDEFHQMQQRLKFG